MLDHTVIRIVEAHPDIFWQISDENKYESLTVFYKWGCDGSSGHSTYRQSFTNSDHNMVDQHLFAICIVPLQLQRKSTILWKNPRPSSTRYCRPLKVMFAKESETLVRAEIENIKSQILKIEPTRLSCFQVQHNLQLTMIDGKVFSVIAESYSQACGICKAALKMMNDLDLFASLPKCKDLYEFGISTLHAWFLCFECMLHVGYRLPIKEWQVRGLDKNIVNQRKEEIQERL